MLKQFTFILSFFLILGVSAPLDIQAQGELNDENSILFRNEKSFSLNLNNHGYGLGFRFGKHKWAKTKIIYQADLFYTKHPKEIKSSSYYYPNKSFVYGKVNTLLNLHLGYGMQQELFSKEDKGGVAIRYFVVGGPTIAFLKPNYYEVAYTLDRTVIIDFDTYYDNSTHAGLIVGDASFFDGLGETRFVPGGFIMLGINFDYHSEDDIYNAIEAGVMFDAYMNNLPIMSENLIDPSPFLFQLFINYRFGSIIDAKY